MTDQDQDQERDHDKPSQGTSDLEQVRTAVDLLWRFASRMVEQRGMEGDDTLTDAEHQAFQEAGGCAHDALAALERLQARPTPVVVLKTNCAPVVNEVIATGPVEVIFVDEDTEGCDELVVVEGEPSWVGHFTAQVDAARVQDVQIQANAGRTYFQHDKGAPRGG